MVENVVAYDHVNVLFSLMKWHAFFYNAYDFVVGILFGLSLYLFEKLFDSLIFSLD